MEKMTNEAHQSGESSLAQEESRKNKFFGMFHIGGERVQENHGHDRNKEGSYNMEMKRGYEQ